MELKNIIYQNTILLDCQMKKRSEVFAYFADKLYDSHLIGSKEMFIQELNQKEEEISTAIGYEIALPHIQSDNITHPIVSFLRSQDGIHWEDPENSRVKLIFLIAVPTHLVGEHINILATLSRKLMQPEVRARLLKMKTPSEIFQILT